MSSFSPGTSPFNRNKKQGRFGEQQQQQQRYGGQQQQQNESPPPVTQPPVQRRGGPPPLPPAMQQPVLGAASQATGKPGLPPPGGQYQLPPSPESFLPDPSQQRGIPGSNVETMTEGALAPPKEQDQGPAWQQEWDKLWEQYNLGNDPAMQQTYADEARAGRGMAAMNAMTGGSMGGAFAGGAGRVAVGGMQARLAAQQAWTERGLEMRMAYLDRLYTDAEREDNQEMMRWIENERSKTARDVAALNASGEADLDKDRDEAKLEAVRSAFRQDGNFDSLTPDQIQTLKEDTESQYGINEDMVDEILNSKYFANIGKNRDKAWEFLIDKAMDGELDEVLKNIRD